MDDIRHADMHVFGASAGHQMKRRTPWDTVEGRVICLVSRKGGVGKTTSAVNLGAALALSGHSVLIVGADPQCGVCRTLEGAALDQPTSLLEIFTGRVSLTSLAQPTALDNLFFVSPRISSLEQEESYLEALTARVDDFIREVDRARNLYDTILIDCPPSLGPATRASLLASDGFLVPVQAEELCRASVDSLLEFVQTFRERNFPGAAQTPCPRLEGLFLTMATERTRMGRHVATRIGEDFGDLVFTAAVPRTTRLSEMALRGKPAVIYDRRSAGSRAYFDLADELVTRYCRAQRADKANQADHPVTARKVAPVRPAMSESEAEDESRPAADEEIERLGAFLAELGGVGGARAQSEDPSLPELVSLDDLLAEEEGRASRFRDEDEGSWSYDLDTGDSLN